MFILISYSRLQTHISSSVQITCSKPIMELNAKENSSAISVNRIFLSILSIENKCMYVYLHPPTPYSSTLHAIYPLPRQQEGKACAHTHTDTHTQIPMRHFLSLPPDVVSACDCGAEAQCRLSCPLKRDRAHQTSSITFRIIIELNGLLHLPVFTIYIIKPPRTLLNYLNHHESCLYICCIVLFTMFLSGVFSYWRIFQVSWFYYSSRLFSAFLQLLVFPVDVNIAHINL